MKTLKTLKTTTKRDLRLAGAVAAVKTYLATGHAGMWEAALGFAAALGVELQATEQVATRGNAEWLLGFLTTNFVW